MCGSALRKFARYLRHRSPGWVRENRRGDDVPHAADRSQSDSDRTGSWSGLWTKKQTGLPPIGGKIGHGVWSSYQNDTCVVLIVQSVSAAQVIQHHLSTWSVGSP